jgi:flagellar hook-associated protein 1 FlgK
VVTATVSDPTALQAKDYVLLYNGTSWLLTDAASGSAVTFAGAGTPASPFAFDGLSVTVSGSATAGDSYLIRPAAGAASRIGLAITDPSEIAGAAPVQTARLSANLSDAAIVPAGITDVSNPALLQPVQIRFEAPATYRIYDAGGTDLTGPLAYTSGADIAFNGWTARISGTAQAGDRFDVGPTGPDSGDNANAQALARTGAQGYLANGQVSVEDLAGRLVSQVGSSAARASQDLTVQSSLREQAQTDLDSVSGVNLDEEAANMLRYQQAYQAASKIIVVANELFSTLLGMLR